MIRSLLAFGAAVAALAAPLASQACTATGYVITVIVPEAFPTAAATIYVRHPTSTGPVSAATSKNPALVSGATAAVTGAQRVLLTAAGGGTGTCPGTAVGSAVELALRP
ncbi:hypothetical protein [Piscinibacter sp. XHJ-5]|uniref:hypothetical protein n=1 Tax=Piscinibacter sp. XHJ-5 TaxID=3037797 RepID=UPI0024532BC1|nr:hypothetical protein [Piscinibacter sp. XHJ-5]